MKKIYLIVLSVFFFGCDSLRQDVKYNSHTLDWSDSDFDVIPCTCKEKPERLVLKNCGINAFGECYNCWPGIKTLNLMNNNIQEIPDEIVHFKDLEVLILNKNKIKQVNYKLAEMRSLKKCFLYFNAISVREIDSLQKMMPWCDIRGYVLN